MKYQVIDDRCGKVIAEFATPEEAKMFLLKFESVGIRTFKISFT